MVKKDAEQWWLPDHDGLDQGLDYLDPTFAELYDPGDEGLFQDDDLYDRLHGRRDFFGEVEDSIQHGISRRDAKQLARGGKAAASRAATDEFLRKIAANNETRININRVRAYRVPAPAGMRLADIGTKYYIQDEGEIWYKTKTETKHFLVFDAFTGKKCKPLRGPLHPRNPHPPQGLWAGHKGMPKLLGHNEFEKLLFPRTVEINFPKEFHSFRKPTRDHPDPRPMPYSTLPRPTELVYGNYERQNEIVTYVWKLDRAAWNKLMHALVGNGVAEPAEAQVCTRKCRFHNHPKSITPGRASSGGNAGADKNGKSKEKPPEAMAKLKGAALRIALKDTEKCELGLDCPHPFHYHDARSKRAAEDAVSLGLQDMAERAAGNADAKADALESDEESSSEDTASSESDQDEEDPEERLRRVHAAVHGPRVDPRANASSGVAEAIDVPVQTEAQNAPVDSDEDIPMGETPSEVNLGFEMMLAKRDFAQLYDIPDEQFDSVSVLMEEHGVWPPHWPHTDRNANTADTGETGTKKRGNDGGQQALSKKKKTKQQPANPPTPQPPAPPPAPQSPCPLGPLCPGQGPGLSGGPSCPNLHHPPPPPPPIFVQTDPAGNATVRRPRTTQADADKIDAYTAQVRLQLHRAEFSSDLHQAARRKVANWMHMCDIPLNTNNVDRCTKILDQELAKFHHTMDSSTRFAMTKRATRLVEDAAKDVEEAKASELFILHPQRWYHAIGRGVRETYREIFDESTRMQIEQVANVQKYTAKYMKAQCCESALRQWLAARKKTMSDLYMNHLDDVLPEGCSLQFPIGADLRCEEKRFPIGMTTSTEFVWIANSTCWHNEVLSVLSRQLMGPTSITAAEGKQRAMIFDLGELLHSHYVSQVSPRPYHPKPPAEQLANYCEGKTAAQLRIIENGRKIIEAGGTVNFTISAFCKVEVATHKEVDKRQPRNVSGCAPDGTHLYAVGPGYYDFQKWYCTEVVGAFDDAPQMLRMAYTGGMQGDKVGAIVSQMEDIGLYPSEGDLNRCDAHNVVEAIDAELRFYQRWGMSQSVIDLLERDKKTTGKTKQGIKYKAGPAQASGRENTSFGTTLRLIFVAMTYMLLLHLWRTWQEYKETPWADYRELITRFCVVVWPEIKACWGVNGLQCFNLELMGARGREWTKDRMVLQALHWLITNVDMGIQLGDDNVLGTELPTEEGLMREVYRLAGQDLEVKKFTPDEYDKVSFCSSWFYPDANGQRVMAPKPFRTALKTCISTDAALREEDVLGYMVGIARGFKNYYWIPVIGRIFEGIAARHTDVVAVKIRGSDNPYKVRLSRDIEFDPTRLAAFFQNVYGMPLSNFDYLSRLDFGQPGTVWLLPGFEEGMIIDDVAAPYIGATANLPNPITGATAAIEQGIDFAEPLFATAVEALAEIGAMPTPNQY